MDRDGDEGRDGGDRDDAGRHEDGVWLLAPPALWRAPSQPCDAVCWLSTEIKQIMRVFFN